MRSIWLITFVIIVIDLFGQTTRQQVNLFNIPNQSAHFIRMPARESSTEIDAAYTNPAGLTSLPNGFHISVNNQFVRQKMTITSDYQNLSEVPTEYEGLVKSFLFPGVFLAWKRNNLVVSGAIILAGGGGGATFDNLPSADMGISDVPEALKIGLLDGLNASLTASEGYDPGYNEIEGYHFDFYSYGVAYSPGYQIGGSYKFNNYFSVAVAARYVTSTSRSEGYIKNIQINVPKYGGYQGPSDYLRFVSQQPELNVAQSSVVNATATLYEELAADRDVDVIQKGRGFTPVVGIHSTPTEKLDIGIKYEHKTAITLKTQVIDGKDGGGQYTDGKEERSDLPAYISMGARYQFTDRVRVAVGSRYFFNKSANYNGREKYIGKNYFEVTSGLEYALTERVKLSGGYTYNHHTVDKEYQNEVDFQTPGHTIAMGGAFAINGKLVCNAGILYTQFVKETNEYEHSFANGVIESEPVTYNRSHAKNALIFALGLDVKLINGD